MGRQNERKTTAILAQSQSHLELLEGVGDAVLMFDPVVQKVLYANQAAVQLLGFSKEELYQFDAESINLRLLSRSCVEVLKNIENYGSYRSTYCILPKSGQVIPVESSHACIDVLGQQIIQSIIRDVTDKKVVQNRLFESEAHLKKVMEVARLGSWTWYYEADKHVWTEGIYQILGYVPDEVDPSSVTFLNRVHEEDKSIVLHALNNAVKNKKSFDISYRLVQAGGKVRYVQMSCRAILADLHLNKLVCTVQDVTEAKQAEFELAAANELLLNQTKREQRVKSLALIQGQEDERQRVSRELHDGIGQVLSATKFTFGTLLKSQHLTERDTRIIQDLKGYIESAISEINRVSNNLMPSVLRDFGLVSAIQKIIEQFSGTPNLKIEFFHNNYEERLPQSIEIGLYRIAQEAVNNAFKYSKSKIIEVHLEKVRDDFIELEIRDNGIGFDAVQEEANGNGLINMRERAELLGGLFYLDSTAEHGTFIHIHVPLKAFVAEAF